MKDYSQISWDNLNSLIMKQDFRGVADELSQYTSSDPEIRSKLLSTVNAFKRNAIRYEYMWKNAVSDKDKMAVQFKWGLETGFLPDYYMQDIYDKNGRVTGTKATKNIYAQAFRDQINYFGGADATKFQISLEGKTNKRYGMFGLDFLAADEEFPDSGFDLFSKATGYDKKALNRMGVATTEENGRTVLTFRKDINPKNLYTIFQGLIKVNTNTYSNGNKLLEIEPGHNDTADARWVIRGLNDNNEVTTKSLSGHAFNAALNPHKVNEELGITEDSPWAMRLISDVLQGGVDAVGTAANLLGFLDPEMPNEKNASRHGTLLDTFTQSDRAAAAVHGYLNPTESEWRESMKWNWLTGSRNEDDYTYNHYAADKNGNPILDKDGKLIPINYLNRNKYPRYVIYDDERNTREDIRGLDIFKIVEDADARYNALQKQKLDNKIISTDIVASGKGAWEDRLWEDRAKGLLGNDDFKIEYQRMLDDQAAVLKNVQLGNYETYTNAYHDGEDLQSINAQQAAELSARLHNYFSQAEPDEFSYQFATVGDKRGVYITIPALVSGTKTKFDKNGNPVVQVGDYGKEVRIFVQDLWTDKQQREADNDTKVQAVKLAHDMQIYQGSYDIPGEGTLSNVNSQYAVITNNGRSKQISREQAINYLDKAVIYENSATYFNQQFDPDDYREKAGFNENTNQKVVSKVKASIPSILSVIAPEAYSAWATKYNNDFSKILSASSNDYLDDPNAVDLLNAQQEALQYYQYIMNAIGQSLE